LAAAAAATTTTRTIIIIIIIIHVWYKGQLIGERYRLTGRRSLNNTLFVSEDVFASVSQRTLVKCYIRRKKRSLY